jgi:hypothetical protein
MKKHIYLVVVLLFTVHQINAQMQNPNGAILILSTHDWDRKQIDFYALNRDFCDYYLRVFFSDVDGYEIPMSGVGISATVGIGKRQIRYFKIKEGAPRLFYRFRPVIYRGDAGKKPNVDFVYALPMAANGTVRVVEGDKDSKFSFDLSADTIYACRNGVLCKDVRTFFNDPNLSQMTVYHADGSFGEYIFKGKPLVGPGEKIKMGCPIGVLERTEDYSHLLLFSVYFLDKNKLKDNNIGHKYTNISPFFQTVNEGKARLEKDKTYLYELTDEMLMQEMSNREKKKFLKNKSSA